MGVSVFQIPIHETDEDVLQGLQLVVAKVLAEAALTNFLTEDPNHNLFRCR